MLIHKKLSTSIEVQNKLENSNAEIERLKGLLDYVAIMSDVEIPVESEEQHNEEFEIQHD